MTTAVKRVPKLDPLWMNALGFVLAEARDDRVRWHNRYLRFYVEDTDSMPAIVRQYTEAVKAEATKTAQLALRESLLGAMGLQVTEEYRDGYVKRSFVAPE